MIQFWQSRQRFSNEKKQTKKKEYNENGRKKYTIVYIFTYLNQKSLQEEFTKSNTGGNLFNKICNVVKNVGKGSREKNPQKQKNIFRIKNLTYLAVEKV